MEYKVQVEDNSYTVKIKDMSSQKEQAETAEDIAYSAFLSEYDHCVQRSRPEGQAPLTKCERKFE